MSNLLTPPTIIAEIGVNYYDIAEMKNISPLDAAKLMINAAEKGGADVAKFQTYKAEKIAAEESPSYWDLSEEPTTSQRVLFSKFDKLTYDNYGELANHCKKVGIEFCSTPFDEESAEKINELVRFHKIASADITNFALLRKMGGFGKPVLLSTGASSKDEIRQAIIILEERGAADITLLHCVLSYPTKINKANLIRIHSLKKDFPGFSIGYSDHTKFDLDVLKTSWLLGAEVIEKHFTLDKSLKGNDHYHAFDPEDLKVVKKEFQKLVTILGNTDTYYGNDEEIARRNARRGVYLNRDVFQGELMTYNDVCFLRPLGDGINPAAWFEMLKQNTTHRCDLKSGSQL